MRRNEKLRLRENQIFGSETTLPKHNGRPHAASGKIDSSKRPVLIEKTMKKIMLLSMLSAFLFTETTNATELKSVTPPPTAVWVKFIINFHRPKMNCESGFGLCFDVTFGVDDAMVSS